VTQRYSVSLTEKQTSRPLLVVPTVCDCWEQQQEMWTGIARLLGCPVHVAPPRQDHTTEAIQRPEPDGEPLPNRVRIRFRVAKFKHRWVAGAGLLDRSSVDSGNSLQGIGGPRNGGSIPP
jgi:hypothetical protein